MVPPANDSGSPQAKSGGERRPLRIIALVGGLAALFALIFLIDKPVGERLDAKTGCLRSSGKWNSETGACDYDPGGTVVRLLEQSKRCQDMPDSDLRQCSYSVGQLKLNIIGVGTSNAAVAVDGSDENFGYGVGIFMGEGCIRVAPGTELKEREPARRIEDGFVSTFTGEVYDSMTMCRVGGIEARRAADATPPE